MRRQANKPGRGTVTADIVRHRAAAQDVWDGGLFGRGAAIDEGLEQVGATLSEATTGTARNRRWVEPEPKGIGRLPPGEW